MVRINSWTENKAGVNELADYTASVFSKYGFASKRLQSINPDCGAHLILTSGEGGIKIGAVSHLDTVFSEQEEADNGFSWRVAGDRVYGPGTNDIKGGTVVLLMVMDALYHISPEIFEKINFNLLFDATEETESDDFGDICRRALNGAAACLIFESGDFEGKSFKLVTSRKGRAVFKITTYGKGAHAGAAHQSGASAIAQMADVIRLVESFTDHSSELTFNTGSVSGGSALNRVPHRAEASVEMRAFSPQAFNYGKERILGLNGYSSVKSGDGSFSCSTEVQLVRENPAWPDNDITQRLYKKFEDAALMLGYSVFPEARGGLSDGNFLWDAVPVIDGLGPAGANCHCSERSEDGTKDQEYALISSFIPKALLVIHAILKITGLER